MARLPSEIFEEELRAGMTADGHLIGMSVFVCQICRKIFSTPAANHTHSAAAHNYGPQAGVKTI